MSGPSYGLVCVWALLTSRLSIAAGETIGSARRLEPRSSTLPFYYSSVFWHQRPRVRAPAHRPAKSSMRGRMGDPNTAKGICRPACPPRMAPPSTQERGASGHTRWAPGRFQRTGWRVWLDVLRARRMHCFSSSADGRRPAMLGTTSRFRKQAPGSVCGSYRFADLHPSRHGLPWLSNMFVGW